MERLEPTKSSAFRETTNKKKQKKKVRSYIKTVDCCCQSKAIKEMKFFSQIVSLFVLFPSIVSALTCSDVSLPCVEIPQCSNTVAKLDINQLSTGLGTSKSSSTASICYTATGLNLQIDAYNQIYYPKDLYTSCNDNVFLLDVIELFIGECSSSSSNCNSNGDTYCYSEIDTSPYNKIFESGIYAPYLNHTGVVNTLIDCDTSHVAHTTREQGAQWRVNLIVPWDVVYNPAGCPSTAKKAVSQPTPTTGSVFRGNIYRVNELVATDKCSSSTCEYVSWAPTYSNPPAFHEPTKFGYFILQ